MTRYQKAYYLGSPHQKLESILLPDEINFKGKILFLGKLIWIGLLKKKFSEEIRQNQHLYTSMTKIWKLKILHVGKDKEQLESSSIATGNGKRCSHTAKQCGNVYQVTYTTQ